MNWIINHNEPHLILQMNDRRAPILILADDCWPSFFTVPVFKSNILPLKANSQIQHNSNREVIMWEHIFYTDKGHAFEMNSDQKSSTVCILSVCISYIPVLLFSAVESCSLSFSVSSGWS